MTDLDDIVDDLIMITRDLMSVSDRLFAYHKEKALQEIADFGQLQDKCEHEYDHNGECLKCDEPMSKWVEITKGECEELYKASEGHWLEYAWAIEAKLKEKNTWIFIR